MCKEGLKPSEELKCKGLGCGGRTKKLVSFTTDRQVAERIYRDLKTKMMIAKGIITPRNFCEKMAEIDPHMDDSPCNCMKKRWERLDDTVNPKKWEHLQQGKITAISSNPPYYVPATATEEQIQAKLYNLWREEYLPARQRVCHGDLNTLFDPDHQLVERYKDLNIDDIGIIEAEAVIPNAYWYDDEYKQKEKGFYAVDWSQIKREEDSYTLNLDWQNKEIQLAKNRFHKLRVIK